MDTFRVRLNCVDHYQATPNLELDPPVPHGSLKEHVRERPKVSVIRVFGATETGQKVLMHIHGAFQYTYVEYSGSLVPEDVEVAIHMLQLSIDHALAVSYRRNAYESKNAYVAHISLVRGIPFYGYHVGYKFYLKIYLLNPLYMTRLADLLREGAVMKRALQPYESHMQYLAQWMCDYNLYGCAYIDCQKVKFRGPVPEYLELNNELHQWHDRSIPITYISDADALSKQSHCSLEVDVCVQDILNRRGVESRPLHHDFIERIRPLPLDAKLVQSMAGLWKDETRRRKALMRKDDTSSSPFPPEVLITMSADPRNTQAGGWIHEKEYRDKVAKLAAEELNNSGGRNPTFESFVKHDPLENSVQTALDSVEDLYPEKLRGYLTHLDANTGAGINHVEKSQVIVDESRIRELVAPYQSEPEMHVKPISSETESSEINLDATFSNELDSGKIQTTPPVSSSEFEKLGVRKIGDFTHVEDDRFEIPLEYQEAIHKTAPTTKRTRFDVPESNLDRKRRRLLEDEENLLPELSLSEVEDDLNGSESETTNDLLERTQASSRVDLGFAGTLKQNNTKRQAGVLVERISRTSERTDYSKQRLAFPVVKDPNDPNTVLRLSQHSSSSQKSAERSSQKAQRPEPCPKTVSFVQSLSLSETTPASIKTTLSARLSSIKSLVFQGLPSSQSSQPLLVLAQYPPTRIRVERTIADSGAPHVIYRDAYYSNEIDVPDRPREYAGREFKLESDSVPFLPDFESTGTSTAAFGRRLPFQIDHVSEENQDRKKRRWCKIKHWNIGKLPPRKDEVVAWLEKENKLATLAWERGAQRHETKPTELSQIDGPTQKNAHGFKYSQKHITTSVQHETQYMSVMALEVHVNTRGNLAPNPEHDEIACIFWCVQTDDDNVEVNNKDGTQLGILSVANGAGIANKIAMSTIADVEEEATELDLLTRMVDIVRAYDPDVLTGYEVHNSSWGYLIERSRLKYDMNLCNEFSRMKSQSHGRFGKDDDKWGFNHTSTIRVTGRHTINIWRAMRGELNLLQYTMETVVFHLLHRRIPHYNFADLTRWYQSKNPRDLSKVIEYFTSRVQIDLQILEANELIPRTSEQARLLGVDWFSVISRGSQFKVESLMFRIAKPENFILISPSRRQVGGQNALECLPLVMEPQSDFYTSPLLVLDFQSLYPSVMIAYNYCYSTFLGRVVSWRGTNKMGFTDYQREKCLLELLKDHVNIAPNGIMYAKTEIRKSLLAKMLSEILETRVMVKSGMKVDKDDKALQRLLNNRQLALKLIANVTYGYTSASFSGRMPCSEIADSIVQTGRETLEKAIALIHSVERWGAEVVYGDTDSLFVYLKGRTRTQAFDIGDEIAEAVTRMNPRPVKLKFEKVYHPCVLLAKKRYVGFKYEHRNQTEPEFDAKGIETVRRDGTPAEQKIEENALKLLFRTADLSQVKSFFQAQCSKIMKGKVSIQDFCFAREVKLGTYSDKGPPPPGALISARRMLEDPRLEPQYGERVPYVVVTGGPGARLIDRCVAPEVLLNDAQSELDAEYYISKNLIPPLERIFNLVGANVRQWYDEMPKIQRVRRVETSVVADGHELGVSKKTLESYMKSSSCIVCRDSLDSDAPICHSCLEHAPHSLLHLRAQLLKAERRNAQLAQVCRSCSGLGWNEEIRCDSMDCPVFYSRRRQQADLASTRAQISPVVKQLEEHGDRSLEW